MLPYEYIAAELAVFAIAVLVLSRFLGRFGVMRKISGIIIFPLSVFVIGFTLRLTGEKEIIDIGYFFTDFGFLFVYLVFAISFILGQMKYWKVQ